MRSGTNSRVIVVVGSAAAAVVMAGSWSFMSTPTQDSAHLRTLRTEVVGLADTETKVCAPPDGAPHWVPNGYTGADATASDPAVDGLVANGRIGGIYLPDTRIRLTGLDACEQRIDRGLVTTADGSFLFTGLMPGRYALLDEHGSVLDRLDLTAESPDRSDLDLVTG